MAKKIIQNMVINMISIPISIILTYFACLQSHHYTEHSDLLLLSEFMLSP